MNKKQARRAKTRIDTTVGINIKNERIARDMTRDELAVITDLSVSHLGLIERGERGATLVTLEKISRAFDISIDNLLKEKVNFAQDEGANSTYFKKVSTLITDLSERELKFLTYVIKGLEKLRNPRFI